MRKPKRNELIKSVLKKTGIPEEGSSQDYLTRKQLLELLTIIEMNHTKIETLTNVLKWVQSEIKEEKFLEKIKLVLK